MRLLDLLSSAFGLLVLSPLFLIVGLLVKATSPGPVFYRGLRVGKDGKPFRLFKFRTMIAGADKQGPGITPASDTRITPVGRWLRDYKIDELPQLINVFKGDMALVGPRPEDPRYVGLYTEEQRRVLTVKPGITSLASLRYRSEEAFLVGPQWEQTYVKRVLPDKLAIELEYLKKRTAWTDLGIILKTLLSVFNGKMGSFNARR